MIDGDGEWDPELVSARVALTDGDGGGVELSADAVGRQRLVHRDGQLVQRGVVHERENSRLDWGDNWGKLEHGLLFVIRANVKGVLKHAVHDAADAKRRFDNGWRVVASIHRLRHTLDSDHASNDLHFTAFSLQRCCAVRLDYVAQGECVGLVQRSKCVSHRLGVALKRFTNRLLVRRDFNDFLLNRFSISLIRHQLDVGLFAVRFQVKRRTIREANTLDPTVRALDFSVPAVGGVVRHFVLQVLTEAQTRGVDTDLQQE